MATVYLAQDAERQQQVAIKIMHPDLVDAIGTERFFREMGIAASLDHPCIVPLYDSGKAGGVPVLHHALCRGRFALRAAAAGEAALHRRGGPHRLRHRRGPGLRPRPRRAAPRRKAGEYPAGERTCAGGGLRAGPGHRCRRLQQADRDRRHRGDGLLHESRAAAREQGPGPAVGYLQPGMHSLRDADGRPALHRTIADGDGHPHPRRGGAVDSATASGRARRRSSRPSSGRSRNSRRSASRPWRSSRPRCRPPRASFPSG